jgi:transposase InsO family protein
MNVYPFIEAEKAKQDGNVAKACVLLEVSRSAYYEWSNHVPSARELSDTELGDRIVKIHTESRATYGAPRIKTKLAESGICVGQKRVARLMVRRGLIGRCKRRFKVTTTPDPDATSLAPDLIKRNFMPQAHEIDTVWCGDITYIRTWEGWLYLATVIDLASRKVVGFAMADHMRAELVSDALDMAIERRQPARGLIFHSDRGSQYTSETFRKLLRQHHVVQSLSRPRQCWDNAVAESWFATLKEELIYRQGWPTRTTARRAIFEFIEVFYNRQRLHSSLGNLTPVAYEERRRQNSGPSDTQAA